MENKKHSETKVSELPSCDFCDLAAEYDGKTRSGPWAYMCETCFIFCGVGLGLGRGQKLVVVAPEEEVTA